MFKALKNKVTQVALMVLLAFGFVTPAAAQIPTGVPAVVSDAVADAYLFIGAGGTIVLGVIATMTMIKWIRGVLF